MKVPPFPPPEDEILVGMAGQRLSKVVAHMRGPTHGGRYLHWDQVRRRQPPADLSHEEWWLLLKWARRSGQRTLPFMDVTGRPFVYILTDEALAMMHRIDTLASGRIEAPDVITNRATRDRYVVSGLMEEAISSSLLEGAATTRVEAKEMLRSGRAPRNKGEQMVVNNYRTMQFIRQDLDQPLTLDMILEIHRMVTEETLERPQDAGRIQLPGERRVDIGDPIDPDVTFHSPPPAEQLPALLEQVVEFANDVESEPFVHPVVRAVAIHFYMAYVHPFVDGNGRTARALFYRSMLRQGYWLTEFISISRLLTRAPVQYGRSFLYTETDAADFTYFLLHQLDIVCRAIDDLMSYLDRRIKEVRSVEVALRGADGLNHRQLALLTHAIRRPDA
ncbi:MAG TPA: Fic family protein, partial [Acidimicrobiia bacterium]|nr:Fic family protein [Acidimicrobiia bacterium]